MADAAASDGKDAKGIYAELGVRPEATSDDIRKAYRRLALRWHPDKNQDNPEATAKFQKISAAYEVLSDAERRRMYDTTGCVNQEELDEEGMGFEHAADIFSAFFGQFDGELDPDEQRMFDEFLSFSSGGNPFRRRGGKRRKGGRAGRGTASAARGMDDFGMFMAAMGGMGATGSTAEPTCEEGHPLKRRKADEVYECDVCNCDILVGKRLYDCRKCDFSMCQKCHKKAVEAAMEDEDDEEPDVADLVEAFCDMNTRTVREGGRILNRCELCRATLKTEDVAEHFTEKHEDELEAFCVEALQGNPFSGAGGSGMPDPMEMLFMAGAFEEMFAGEPKAKGKRTAQKKRR